MNFLHQGLKKFLFDRETDTTEIIYHSASPVVKNYWSEWCYSKDSI